MRADATTFMHALTMLKSMVQPSNEEDNACSISMKYAVHNLHTDLCVRALPCATLPTQSSVTPWAAASDAENHDDVDNNTTEVTVERNPERR